MLVGLCRWIHPASGHRRVLSLVCEGFNDSQRETLSTPAYKIRKDRKSGALVSPKDVTVISSVEMEGHASPPSAQVSAHASAPSTSSDSSMSFVTSAQFEAMSDRWAEQFTRFEALLSWGNVFSMPRSSAAVSSHPVLSDKPFIEVTKPDATKKEDLLTLLLPIRHCKLPVKVLPWYLPSLRPVMRLLPVLL